MLQLLNHQKELGHMLEAAMQTSKEQNFDMESIHANDNNFELVTEELDNETESIKEEVASVCSIKNEDDESDSNDMTSQESTKLSLQCTKCEISFRSNRSLQTHLKTHMNLYSCSICGSACKDDEYLELHMNVHEGKTENECRYCPKKYSRRSHVIRHMHLHWDKKKFQCEKCGLRFSQANVLYNHKMNHEAEEDPLICNVCQQTFKSKRTFKNHMIIHQEDRPMYPCEVCGKVFTQKYTIRAHLKTHSEGYEDLQNSIKKAKSFQKNAKQFHCIICERMWVSQEALDIHMAQEHDVISKEA